MSTEGRRVVGGVRGREVRGGVNDIGAVAGQIVGRVTTTVVVGSEELALVGQTTQSPGVAQTDCEAPSWSSKCKHLLLSTQMSIHQCHDPQSK